MTVIYIRIAAGILAIALLVFLAIKTMRRRDPRKVPSRISYVLWWVGTIWFALAALGSLVNANLAGLLIMLALFGLCLANLIRSHRVRSALKEQEVGL